MNFSVIKKQCKKTRYRDMGIAILFFCALLLPTLFHTIQATGAPSIQNLALSYTYIDGVPHFTVSGEVVSALPGASITYGLLIQRTNFGELWPPFTVTNAFSQVTNGPFSITLSYPTIANLNQTSATNVRIRLTVTDASGVSVTFDSASLSVLDIPPENPSVTITAPVLEGAVTGSTVIAFTATSGNKECRINNEPFLPCEKNVTTLGELVDFENLSPGVHALTVRFVAHPDAFDTSSFTVLPPPDTTPPEVIETVPEHGAETISLTTDVSVTFSETPIMNAENISFIDEDGTAVPLTFVLEDTTLTITPNDTLKENTLYTVTLSGVTDGVGNGMEIHTFSFSTEIIQRPVVSSGGARSAYDPPEPILPPPLYVLPNDVPVVDGEEDVSTEEHDTTFAAPAVSSPQLPPPPPPILQNVAEARPVLSVITTPQEPQTFYTEVSIPMVSSVGMVHTTSPEEVTPNTLPSAETLMASAGAVPFPEMTPFLAGLLFTLCGLGLLSFSVLLSRGRRFA